MSSKKKLLILSSTGGYGHIAAANTLENLLSDEYEIDVIYPINELKMWHVPNGEAFYNFVLTNNFTRFTNWVVRSIPHRLFRNRTKKIISLIERHIRSKNIDLVISLIPFINFPASEAARKLGVPFLLVTTDNDLQNWVCDLHKKSHPYFKVTVGADLATSKSRLLTQNVLEQEIEITGLPLRPDFLEPRKTKAQLRVEYEIPPHKNVILIIMGGTGARLSYRYVKTIAHYPLNLHFIVCAGRNQKLVKKLKSIQPASGNTIDVVPFTEKVQELFALSDLIITKPGPGTINEAISCQLPILIDKINPPLFWEEANVHLVERLGIGSCIYRMKDAPKMVERFLLDEKVRDNIAQAYKKISPNQFATRIKPIIREMTSQSIPGEMVMTSRAMNPPQEKISEDWI